jgi:tRNA pseudouridine55 synthase
VVPFGTDDMVPLVSLTALEEVEDQEARLEALDAYLIDTGEALATLPQVVVNDDQARRLRLGNAVVLRGRDAPLAEAEAFATTHGKLVAIGEIGQGEFRPKRVFAG